MQSVLTPILLTAHIMLAAALIGVVLLQKSEGGLGGLGGGGMSGFMTSRGSANLLTRTTRWLAAAFMVTSLLLAWIASHAHTAPSLVTAPTPVVPGTPPEPPSAPAPTIPSTGSATPAAPAPSAPAVPTSQ